MSMKKAMIMSVGTGTRPTADMASPLLKSVRQEGPDLLFLLVTEESRATARQIQEKLHQHQDLPSESVILRAISDSDGIHRRSDCHPRVGWTGVSAQPRGCRFHQWNQADERRIGSCCHSSGMPCP